MDRYLVDAKTEVAMEGYEETLKNRWKIEVEEWEVGIEDLRDSLDKHREYLTELETFLEDISMVWDEVFTESHKVLEGKEALIKGMYGEKESLNLQMYLAWIADKYLQGWLQKNNIEEKYKVYLRESREYPTEYIIVLDDIEMVEFSLENKEYLYEYKGVPKNRYTVNQQKQLGRLRMIRNSEELRLQECLKEYEKETSFHNKIKNKVRTFMVTGNNYIEDVVRKVQNAEIRYKDSLVKIEKHKLNYKYGEEMNNKRLRAVEVFDKFFKELGYIEKE